MDNCDLVDPEHIGILGWCNGGLYAFMNVFDHPEAYQAAFAGVPVNDLIARMGYKIQRYRDMYSADYHIGKTAYEDVNEYRRRSPAWQVEKLKTSLLINTNTIDEDVNVLEVEHLIKSLKAAGKDFEYKIYEDFSGGHVFDRIDATQTQKARKEIYEFLAKHLHSQNSI